MFRRILFALSVFAVAAHAATETYQRSEAFNNGPPKNWGYFNPNQGYGYFPTNSKGAGDAGGFFFPKTFTSYYSDKQLGGFFTRGMPLSASGTITLEEVSFDPNYSNTVYIGHFRKGGTNDTYANIIGFALTGNDSGAILCRPVVEFSDGSAFIGSALKLAVDATPTVWSYSFDPNGGAEALGLLTVTIGNATTTLTLGRLSGGIDYVLDSFGLFQPAFVQPNSNSYFTLFIDDLDYTAFAGKAPKLKVKGPKTITTSASTVTVSGTAKVSGGNRIKSVRYRTVKNGKPGRYHTADGESSWSASVKVPSGTSRLEIVAISDSGLRTEAKRTLVRNP